MSPEELCPSRTGEDVVHRYVAGTLEAAAVEVFEQHLLACDACQRAVRDGAALRVALREEGLAVPRRRQSRWAAAAALAAAAVLVVLSWPSDDPLERLARVDSIPAFRGLPVRSDPDSAATIVDRGMAAYTAGEFRRAAELLASAVALDTSPGPQFFLGISRLKTREAAGAVTALRGALEPPDNPYAAEARLYLAKAWLALGEPDSALAQLGAVPRDAADVHAHAIALGDSLRAVVR